MADPTELETLRQQVADLTAKLSEAQEQAAPARRIRELEAKLEKLTAKAASKPDPTAPPATAAGATSPAEGADTSPAAEPDDWDAIGA